MESKPFSTTTTRTTRTTTTTMGVVGMFRLLRPFLLTLPLYATFIVWLAIHGLHVMYHGPLSKLVSSYEISELQDDYGLYMARDPEITYYNRQCHIDDISTHDANDLLIHDDFSRDQRKSVMMNHGAVVMKNILSQNTSSRLREYLERRHDTFIKNDMVLPWNELFWNGGDGSRLSLGIGPEDDPIIAQALHEVGHNRQLEETLTAIVGPNPALVEVSTLTTMHGASHQGIHTDSDYFGSSVLYARTFLHSYTMFVALQDTTGKMGATTLCPGTHFCANEDLEDVCMTPAPDGRRNSFEASSNGETGLKTGVLLQGDAMMFNQNVWHRGPRNKDPDRPYNRAMFILTFVSQRDFEKGDVRQQGWGTYYYMRHSMWGQAFNDLKTVLKGGMSLPIRFLKAYGLYSTPSSGNGRGMPWLEHWARQMANEMDFFAPSELQAFHEMLQKSSLPSRILGNPTMEDWNQYLTELVDNAVEWINGIYLLVLFVYFIIHLVIASFSASTPATKPSNNKKKKKTVTKNPSLWRSLIRFFLPLAIGHMVVAGIAVLSFSYVMTHAPLFRRIGMGYIFRKPFPILDDTSIRDHLKGRITTVPDRMDVLIGSRYDAPYLRSMNEMLNYHPGNKEWNKMIHETAGFPMIDVASEVLVRQVTSKTKPLNGVVRRFLLQEYAGGYWTVMTSAEAERETRLALGMADDPLLSELVSYWKEVLADSRFGRLRDTAMSKIWTPKIVNHWMDKVLFPEQEQNNKVQAKAKAKANHHTTRQNVLSSSSSSSMMRSRTFLVQPFSSVTASKSSFREHLQELTRDVITLKVDDIIVLVKGTSQEEEATRYAKIVQIATSKKLLVRYVDSYDAFPISIDGIQPHVPIQQGDRVIVTIPPMMIDENDTTEQQQQEEEEQEQDGVVYGVVLMMYPTGDADVLIDNDGTTTDDSTIETVTVSLDSMYLEWDEEVMPEYRLDWRRNHYDYSNRRYNY